MFASKDTLLTRPSGGYTIARSVRFRQSASAYFNRTTTTPTSGSIFTHSFWVKRGILGSLQTFISGARPTNFDRIYISATDTLLYQWNDGTSNLVYLETTQVFRDPSAWYHIIVATDTTQATASNRVKIYVNGVQVTALSSTTYPTQNSTSYLNINAGTLNLGRTSTAVQYLDGYLTETNFVDGQQLTPSSFGSTNAITGVWQPAKYTGTYGTNGFYLNFSDNSAVTTSSNVGIGKDFSGNGNYWTSNNISVTAGTTYDSMTDVPTLTSATAANYATLNPLAVGSSGTLSDGSLKIAGLNSANVGASYSTIGMTTGKWYFEVTAVGVGSNFSYALVEDVVDTSALNVSGSIFAGYRSTGDTYGTVSITTTTWNTTNVVIGVAVDCDNGAVYFANANTWINSGVPTSGASRTGAITTYTGGTKTLHGGVGCYQDSSQSAAINFGQRPFTYTPPTGFVALNTYNLPTSTITNGAAYMAATLYTGTGASLTVANTVGSTSFQPDWVWAKSRSAATDHALYDSVRGVQKQLESNNTDAETTETTGLTAFGSTGFTVGALAQMNTSAATYVAWQWKAGTTSASNTNGSITSTVSVGATQGFSVVTYTGNGSSSATVGHGLGVVPAMVITKGRSAVTEWMVKHQSLPTGQNLLLNQTLAASSSLSFSQGVIANLTSSTTFGFTSGSSGVDNANQSGVTFVAYCFSAVAGYSAFGSYTGNGSTDGTFVYLGFRPRWIMVKDTTNAGTDWVIFNTSSETYNVVGTALYPNSTNTESTNAATWCDILSNGFKNRRAGSANTSSATIIYAAFAENPFRNALAR